MSIFALSWYAIERRQIRKDARNSVHPGTIPTWEYRMWRASFPIDSAAKPGTLHTNERSSDPSYTQGPDAPHDIYPGVNKGGETSLVLPYRVASEASDKSGRGGEASF